jgi:hypothetical protein
MKKTCNQINMGGIDMSTTEEILDLLGTNGQSGPDMTQALKAIGGDMKSGLKRIGDFFFDEGMSEGYQAGVDVGERNGLLKGSAITLGLLALVQGSVYLYGKHKEKKNLKAQEAARKDEAKAIKETIRTVEVDLTDVLPNAIEVDASAGMEAIE